MTEHYYTERPTSKSATRTFTTTLRGQTLHFTTDRGVFSLSRIDYGTRLLIEQCRMEDGWQVLDLGCGYGAVGITIKKAFPHTKVVCSDINERALALTRINAQANNVEVQVIQSHLYEGIEGNFDTILVNPPQTAGKRTCEAMISSATTHLRYGGSLQLVARHQKGGKTLAAYMEQTFGNVESIAKQGGYRIYKSNRVDL